ncbi:MAG: hypothetical protein U0996_07050 [Planctomycetaceae bacterium]
MRNRFIGVAAILAVLLSAVWLRGCSSPDFPRVEYPPEERIFGTPDVTIQLPPFALMKNEAVACEPVEIAKTSAKVLVEGTLTDDVTTVELEGYSVGVFFLTADGKPLSTGLTFPQTSPDGVRSIRLSLLGPARPGKYQLAVRRLGAESSDHFEFLRTAVAVGPGQ